MNQDVLVAADLVLTQHDLKGILEINLSVDQRQRTNRDQVILVRIESAGFNIDNDITAAPVRAVQIGRRQLLPCLDDLLLLWRETTSCRASFLAKIRENQAMIRACNRV